MITAEKKAPRDLILETAFSGEDVVAANPFEGVVMNLVEHLLKKYGEDIAPGQPIALVSALKEAITLGMQAGEMTLGEIARYSR
jgi:uncharacterized protein (DUF697 family)